MPRPSSVTIALYVHLFVKTITASESTTKQIVQSLACCMRKHALRIFRKYWQLDKSHATKDVTPEDPGDKQTHACAPSLSQNERQSPLLDYGLSDPQHFLCHHSYSSSNNEDSDDDMSHEQIGSAPPLEGR